MKTVSLLIFLSGLVFLSYSSATETTHIYEPIYGTKLEKNEITFWVRSTGCTKEIDFELLMADKGPHYSLFLSRNQKDLCRKMPRMIAVTFPVNIKSNNKINLENPLQMWH